MIAPVDKRAGSPAEGDRFSVRTEAERGELLAEWNSTKRDYPQDKCLHQLFEEQVERTPESVAVMFEGRSLSYWELNARANQLGYRLRSLGVGPDVLVGLCVERSLEMAVALLGILKAGGAYVPLDPEFPQERLEFMVEDAAMFVLLTEHRVADRLGKAAARVLWLDEFAWHPGPENPPPQGAPSSLAHVIYTSGSTGKPKGVQITHQALVNCLHHFQRSLDLRPHDVWLAVATYSFDIAGLEIWLPLLTGARVVIGTRATAKDGRLLSQALIEHGVTILQGTPTAWQMLLHSGWQGKPGLQIISGGEALPQALADRLAVLGARAWNAYGPTETTIYSTVNQLLRGQPVNIGRPLSNTQVYVVNARGQPVPIGLPGELWIGGDGLARGYHNRPELTAERFVPDRFSARPGARLYRTGDLARWRADGNLELLGRMDSQVKIRGYRIEVGEIESVLGGHPGVSACVVTAQNHHVGGDKSLAAFVVARAEGSFSAGALRQWLGKKLPDYMIPSRFVGVPTLPLSPTGKVDRKALEKMEGTELAAGSQYVAPRTELERQLAGIWGSVLDRERVGVQDNFLELGGHSLLAVVLCSQLIQHLNREVPLCWVFEHPTVESLARQMEHSGEPSPDRCRIDRADPHRVLPMSFAQQRMWLLQQTLPDPAAYNQPFAWRLSGPVDRERFRRTLRALVARHEILRTALVQREEDLIQVVAAPPGLALPWRELDLQSVPLSGQGVALEEELLAESRRRFDLAQAPLWRALWVQLASEDQAVALTFQHSIVDEWSVRLFFQELEQLYACDGRAEPARLPELPIQYADWACWERQRLTGALLEDHRSYWREQLQDLPPPLELPADLVRPVRPSGQGAVHQFQIADPAVTRLRELAREEGTTLFTVVLAAFQVWLFRYAGQTDVVVGSPITNRLRSEAQGVLGFFLNTLPLRLRLDGNPTFRQALRQARERVLGAFSHVDLPFEQMVELAAKGRTPGQQPLYQVMFVLLEQGLPAFRLDHVQAAPLSVHTRTCKSDLILSIQAAGKVWNCQLEYATDLFSAGTAARMARHLSVLLQSIAEEPEKSIDQLPFVTGTERAQLLVEWNRTAREYPRNHCVHQLFTEQAERTPEAVAVVSAGHQLSYRELNLQADRLALHLRSLGVGPGQLVGMRVERSPEMVIAVLGILKAGGAYWALEENLPEERLRLLLADARPRVLLVAGKAARQLADLALPEGPGAAVTVAAIEDLLASVPRGTIPAEPLIRAEDPAYVSYTSGSTGCPKGVVVPHRGVVRLVRGTDYVSLTPEETLLQLSPLAFDASTFELWGALLNGGRVVLLPPGPPDLADIGAAITQYGVTTLWLTAGLFHLMVDQRVDDLKPLRQLLAGGDVLSPKHVLKARRALTGCRIINGYGPTENTTFTCCYTVAEEGLTPSVPIGRPIANTRVYVLDPQRQPVPVGVSGELYAGGDGLACGYLHQPELTAERFVPDPFSAEPGARLYRTGDLVRWRPDGNLEFLGRLDSQVKIRGYRVELGEIESVLGSHPGLSACAVMPRRDPEGHKYLAAFVVARDASAPAVGQLRAWLSNKLPDYLVPSRFLSLPELPLTPNGKVDRKRLERLDLEEGRMAHGAAPVLPSAPLEARLVEIWQTVLHRAELSIDDDFFQLGGCSLLAVQVQARVEKELGTRLPLATFFQATTVRALAGWIRQPGAAARGLFFTGSTAPHRDTPLFCVHGLDLAGGLATHLEPLWSVYGLDPSYEQELSRWGESQRVELTIEDLAARYLANIQSVQPHGPYFLAGFCFGGVLAFEVARQLHAKGETAALLALLDATYLPGLKRRPLPWLRRGAYYAGLALRRGPAHLLGLARQTAVGGQWRRAGLQTRLAKVLTGSWNVESSTDQFYLQMLGSYQGSAYPGSALLVRIPPTERSFHIDFGATNGWDDVILGGVEVEDIPAGGHLELLKEPHLGQVAAHLAHHLRGMKAHPPAAGECRPPHPLAA